MKRKRKKRRKISIVIPAFNEEKNVTLLYKELKKVLAPLGDYEIIFVDDGSTDNTFKELEKIHKNGRVKIVKLKRNFKKGAAMAAGLKEASGNYIITMDADLQDNPSEIPRFLDKIEKENYDMIVGWKYPRLDPLSKRLPSKIFNFLVRGLTGVRLHDCDNNFRIFHSELKNHIPTYGGFYRYIPVIAHWKGFRIGEIKVQHRKRIHGKSKWGVSRLFRGFFDLLTIKYITSFSESPSHLFASLGSLSLGAGFITGLYLLYLKYFLGELIGDRPLLLLSILMIVTGIQFMSFGLLTETFRFNNRKDETYIIEKKLV